MWLLWHLASGIKARAYRRELPLDLDAATSYLLNLANYVHMWTRSRCHPDRQQEAEELFSVELAADTKKLHAAEQ